MTSLYCIRPLSLTTEVSFDVICETVEALKLKDRIDMDKLCSDYAAIAPLLLAIISPTDTSDKKSSALLWRETSVC